jgi:Domain of unknown function (DUF222)/HNH endonuclease
MELLVEKRSTAELMDEAERLGTLIASSMGSLLAVLGELERREGWRSEGATSLGAWLTQRCGVSEATGRAWAHVAERLDDLPHLAQGLRVGALSFDKVRAAVDIATPESDAEVLRQAEDCSVRQLTELGKDARGATDEKSAARYEARFLRFNDARTSISAQLPEDLYAEVRAAITDRARDFPSDGETPYDQRRCDAFVHICRMSSGRASVKSGTSGTSEEATTSASDSRRDFFVVAHTDLSLLRGGTGTAEIERLGLLSPEAIKRITCDSRVALALDDSFGHTMFEGRSRRYPTGGQRREATRRDRRCRFPGCANNSFTHVHHVVHWIDGGPTDLENLVTLCTHHHHRVHEGQWKVTGNANGILRFVGPSGRVMTSRPSPLWTRRKD